MWKFWLPCAVHFDGGQLPLVGKLVDGARHATIVCGANSAQESGALGRLETALGDEGIASVVYDGVSQNPRVEEVDCARELINEFNSDIVICIGGGSAMDLGKAAALLADAPGATIEYLTSKRQSPRSGKKIMTIPTTVGTGAEISRGAVLSAHTVKLKDTLRGDGLFPSEVVIDHTLLGTLPRRQAALGCFDLFAHLVEGYHSQRAQPFTDALVRDALPRLINAVPRFLDDRQDTQAQSTMAYLSLVGGVVLGNSSTCMPHRIQYAIASVDPGMPHACGVGLLFPSWLRIVEDHAPDRLRDLAAILYPSDGIRGLQDWVLEFLDGEGMPQSLADAGISPGDLDVIASRIKGDMSADSSYGPGRVEQMLEYAFLVTV